MERPKKEKAGFKSSHELVEQKRNAPMAKVDNQPLAQASKMATQSTLKNEPKFECMKNETARPVQKTMTKITVKCNCGFGNNLYIRGQGVPGLTWEKGIVMKNLKADEWVWESDKPFTKGEIKVTLNDKQFEVGPNHIIECSKQLSFIPRF